MMERVNVLMKKLEGLTTRERMIVLFAGVILIALSWYMLYGEPAVERGERFQSEITAAQTQLADLDARVTQQTLAKNTQPDPQAKLAELRLRRDSVEEKIQSYAAELISPTEMARLLERVLERRSALRLLRLRNSGAEDLLPEDSPGQNRLYRHGLQLELEGPYLAVLAYLKDLEALPWRLYWQVLDIETDEYPINRVRIEVATLSLDEDWIGV